MTYACLIKALLFACLVLFKPIAAIADDDDLKPDATAIHISDDSQTQAGIETITLKAARHRPEFLANGKAINLQPLLALRNSYLINLTEQRSAKAKLTNSAQNTERLQDYINTELPQNVTCKLSNHKYKPNKHNSMPVKFKLKVLLMKPC